MQELKAKPWMVGGACLLLAAAFVAGTWERKLLSSPREQPQLEILQKAAEKKISRVRFKVAKRKSFAGRSLANANLYVVAYHYSNFRDADLSGTRVEGALFNGTSLNRANFSGAVVLGSTFQESDMRRSRFSGTRFADVTFFGCDLRDADLRGASAEKTAFLMSRLEGALFNGSSKLPFSREEAERRGMKYVD